MNVPNHKVKYEPPRIEVVHAVSNHDKVKRVFHPQPPISLEEGICLTCHWYEDHGKSFQPVEFDSVEIIRHMPPAWIRPGLKETLTCNGTRVGNKALIEHPGSKNSFSMLADKHHKETLKKIEASRKPTKKAKAPAKKKAAASPKKRGRPAAKKAPAKKKPTKAKTTAKSKAGKAKPKKSAKKRASATRG